MSLRLIDRCADALSWGIFFIVRTGCGPWRSPCSSANVKRALNVVLVRATVDGAFPALSSPSRWSRMSSGRIELIGLIRIRCGSVER